VVDEPISRVQEASKADRFRALAAEHLDESYRLARAILGNPAEAEDATHDAYVQAWRKWSSLRDPALFERWFGRILVNTCRNRLRASKRRRSQDLSDELLRTDGEPFRQTDDRDLLRAALSSLTPDHQVVVALRFYRDLPVRDIAEHLGIPEGTVHSRLHYALRHLRDVLGSDDAPGAFR
jgi:RNA polymerase sigma-70 factor, ECF subfamily